MKSKPITIMLFLLIMLLLAACQAQEPDTTATPEPTAPKEQAVPATEESQEPTAEPTEMVSETDSREQGSSPGFELLDESFVEMPENYLMFFNKAGAVNIGADCNSASGSYTFDGSSMTIELGPMTLAACEEESRSDQFVNLLGSATIAFFEDGNLNIDLMADGGTMVFTPEE